ncbi:sigma-70 family RNA polymerase sigma factor [uncultured Prevotella sp.]|uniref:RNA polymerase sigma factor n=1 Tax=uncultured Prevotella sp. TaxID=159272 RepID=UPI00262B77B1|nr:sigma-70 family RNA polymerase sigma factor [uncultured Prevotella sp.]
MKPEERLVRNIKNGDRAAMRRLYDLYSGYIMAIVMRYVPDKDDVPDVVQEAFIKIFTSIVQYEYRGEGTLKMWLSRVTANEALGFLRRKGNITFTDNIPDEPIDDEPDISQISDEALTEMIASLPEGYRVVLNLYVFGQMSHKEIADELGITPSTSASQFYHAKKMLADKIKEYNKRNAI